MYTSYICEYNVYKHTSIQAERNFELKDIKQHFKTFDFNFIFKKIVLRMFYMVYFIWGK